MVAKYEKSYFKSYSHGYRKSNKRAYVPFPEGANRRALCRAKKVDETDFFGMLELIIWALLMLTVII